MSPIDTEAVRDLIRRISHVIDMHPDVLYYKHYKRALAGPNQGIKIIIDMDTVTCKVGMIDLATERPFVLMFDILNVSAPGASINRAFEELNQ